MLSTVSEITLHAPDGTYAPYAEGMRPVAERCAELLPRDGWLLDLGCGVGSIALWVKKHRPDVEVAGTDINALAIEAAQTNAEGLGLDVYFLQGNLYWPVRRMVFDVIAVTVPWEPPSAYPHPPEAPDAYMDRNRVLARALVGAPSHLRPGGRVVVYSIEGLEPAFEQAGLRVLEVSGHIYTAEVADGR